MTTDGARPDLIGPPPLKQYLVRAGGTGDETVSNVAIDKAGNLYLLGFFNGTAKFGNQTLTVSKSFHKTNTWCSICDAFVAKLGPDGKWRWATPLSGIVPDTDAAGIAVTPSGDAVWIGGYIAGDVKLGTQIYHSNGGNDVVIVGLDAQGVVTHANHAGGFGSDGAYDVAIEPSGAVLVTGVFSNKAAFGSTILKGTGAGDTFVARVSQSGSFEWAKRVGDAVSGAGWSRGHVLAVMPSGELRLTGVFAGKVDFGGSTLQCGTYSQTSAFVAGLDSAGKVLWAAKPAGEPWKGSGDEVAVAAGGATYVGGRRQFGATLTWDLITARLDTAGKPVWEAKASGASSWCTGLALRPAGGAYVTGYFNEGVQPLAFGASKLTSMGGTEAFLAVVGSDGKWSSTMPMGGPGDDEARGVVTDAAGNVYVVGSFEGTGSFGKRSLKSTGKRDLFVWKIPSGEQPK